MLTLNLCLHLSKNLPNLPTKVLAVLSPPPSLFVQSLNSPIPSPSSTLAQSELGMIGSADVRRLARSSRPLSSVSFLPSRNTLVARSLARTSLSRQGKTASRSPSKGRQSYPIANTPCAGPPSIPSVSSYFNAHRSNGRQYDPDKRSCSSSSRARPRGSPSPSPEPVLLRSFELSRLCRKEATSRVMTMFKRSLRGRNLSGMLSHVLRPIRTALILVLEAGTRFVTRAK